MNNLVVCSYSVSFWNFQVSQELWSLRATSWLQFHGCSGDNVSSKNKVKIANKLTFMTVYIHLHSTQYLLHSLTFFFSNSYAEICTIIASMELYQISSETYQVSKNCKIFTQINEIYSLVFTWKPSYWTRQSIFFILRRNLADNKFSGPVPPSLSKNNKLKLV